MKLSEVPTGISTTPPPVVAIQSPPVSVDTQPCLDTSSPVSLEVTEKVPDWEAMYNTLAEDIIGYETKIAELTNDSENVCTQLSLSRAKCVKLEEALGAARSDAEIGKSEAQSMHMRLLASKNVVSDAAVVAEK